MTVVLRSFPAGAKVGAYQRTGEEFPGVGALGRAVKTATVDNNSEVSFKGLEDGEYWAVDEDGNRVRFTEKEIAAPKTRVPAPTQVDPQKHPVADPGVTIVTGARGTKIGGLQVETPIRSHEEPHPHLNQASVAGSVPQRSNTALGQATPVDPDEPQPKPRQDQVKKGTPQMSDTPLGEATPVVPEAGPKPQDEAKKRLKQRSDTEEGEQTPIGSAEPRGTASNPDSREQAAGVRPTDAKVKARGKASARPKVASKTKKK